MALLITAPVLARRLLPASFVIPVGLGWLCLAGLHRGLHGTEFGLTLMVVCTAMLVGGLVFAAVRMLRRLDEKGLQAEQALREKHGGRIELDPSPGPRARFSVHLPIQRR